MNDTPETARDAADLGRLGFAMTAAELRDWFVREVLPLETALMQFLQRNRRNASDVEDLLQDVYTRVCEAALRQPPESTRAFVFTTARNLLIDRIRHERVISIEAAEDLEAFDIAADDPGIERNISAREELRILHNALDRLSPRCREVVVLRRIEGISRRQIAARLGISEATVAEHLAKGIGLLADSIYREASRRRS